MAILLVILSTLQQASAGCFPSAVLIYADSECNIDPAVYEEWTFPIDLWASDYPWDIKQVTFEVENWIGNPGYPIGLTSVTWFADKVQGSIDGEITLSWEAGLPPNGLGGTRYSLGEIEFLTFDPDWPENGHEILLKNLVFEDVGGHVFVETHESRFIFTDDFDDDGCFSCCWDPPVGWLDVRWFDPPSGSEVERKFDLAFEVQCHHCFGGPNAYEGEITHDGLVLFEFFGWGEVEYEVPLSIDGVELGEEFTLEINVTWYENDRQTKLLTYTLVDQTPTRSSTFSEVKTSY